MTSRKKVLKRYPSAQTVQSLGVWFVVIYDGDVSVEGPLGSSVRSASEAWADAWRNINRQK